MAPDGEDFRFSDGGWARREELLAAAEAHLRSLEPRLPDRLELSRAARRTLARHLAGDHEVTDDNRGDYRELARAGIMESVGTFTKGDDCVFQLTRQGWDAAKSFSALASPFCIRHLPEPFPGLLTDLKGCFRPTDSAASFAVTPHMVGARAVWYNAVTEVAMTLTDELKQAIERAGDEPVRVEDPDTHTAYMVIKEDLYRKLREAVPESDFTLHEFEELISSE